MSTAKVQTTLRMPAEHGAWGILLVPFFCAAAVAGSWNASLLFAGACVFGLFLLRASLKPWISSKQIEDRGAGGWRSTLRPAHYALVAATGAAAGLLVFVYHRYQFIWIGLAALLLYLFRQLLIRPRRDPGREQRSLAAELVGVGLLTLTAPIAWIAARGVLEPSGVRVWLLNLLFFCGGVVYVKYRVRGLLAHRHFRSAGERLAFAWPVFVYHLLLAAFLAYGVILGRQPATILLAFIPGILRANGLLFQLGRRFAISRLGWNEIVHSLLFALLLVLAFRTAS